MALTPGTRLGPYEVLGPLGAGGMGEVYRARDTTLGRDVAVKVLPEHLAHDPERLARFEREAKTLALLNHPHIAQIHGFEHAVPSTTAGQPGSGPAVRALVMELVEGPTLADRIARLRAPGASARQAGIPLDEAWPIARQIAEALEAAHDQGIVHRDLKPANIKVRPDGMVKVLDFGLAKATTSDSSLLASDSLANSPTVASPVHLHGYGAAGTEAGMILGTAAYMSPEQAKGKPVDRRADIWAFGCVLFEMLTGRRAYEGEDVSDTLAAVLRGEPRWDALPPETSARVRTLLHRCIERDLKKRLPHIGVARLELAAGAADDTPAFAVTRHGPQARASWRTHAAWAAVAAAALASGVALSTRWRRDGRELFFVDQLNRVSVAPVDLRGGFSLGRPTPLFEIPPTAGVTGGVSVGGVLDVFPDGQRFAIVAPRTVTSGVTLTVAVDWMADLKK